MKILSCLPEKSPQIEDVEFDADFLHDRLGFSFNINSFGESFIIYTRPKIGDKFNCMMGNRAVNGPFFITKIDKSHSPPQEIDLTEEDISNLTTLVEVSRKSAQIAEA